VAYQALLRSSFARQFAITFVDVSMVRDIRQLGQPGLAKLWRFGWCVAQECWHLATKRFALVCLPVSVNRNAFIKDALLAQVAMLFRVPVVFFAHGNNLPDLHDRSSPRFQRFMANTLCRAAGAIVLGERLRFNFTRWLPAERIQVAPIGIVSQGELPSRSASGPVTVLYLGNLIREKGVFMLLEAARQCPQIQFNFAGAWYSDRDEAEARATAGSNVEFLGPVTGQAKWQTLAKADILAFPTFYHYETMGLVILEAMQAGLPVVTTRRASIPEIIQDGVNGLFVNEQDVDDLAMKILRLAGDPDLRARMGAANRERFAAHYTHEQFGQRMAQLFDQIARQEEPERQQVFHRCYRGGQGWCRHLSYLRLAKVQLLRSFLRQHQVALCGRRVFDYGFGAGTFFRYCPRDAKLAGVELDPQTVAEVTAALRRRGYVDVRLATSTADRPFFGEQFDVILCSHVLEHLANPVGLLHQAAAALAPSGGFVGLVPIHERRANPHHLHCVDRATVEAWALAAGLRLQVYREADPWLYWLQPLYTQDAGWRHRLAQLVSLAVGLSSWLLGERLWWLLARPFRVLTASQSTQAIFLLTK